MFVRTRPLLKIACRNMAHKYQPVLSSLSSNVLDAEYSVRGRIPIRGSEIQTDIKKGILHDGFTQTTALNIGNP
jgi:hypothetical protein